MLIKTHELEQCKNGFKISCSESGEMELLKTPNYCPMCGVRLDGIVPVAEISRPLYQKKKCDVGRTERASAVSLMLEIIYACAQLSRMFDQPGMAVDILEESGINPANADEYDVAVLRDENPDLPKGRHD